MFHVKQSMICKIKVVIILGPTASGKTELAVQLAQKTGGEIISADSRQVFKGMDIGSGKDLSEYGSVPYHLIDIRPAGGEYSVSDFQKDAFQALSDISARNHFPIICGGTGHYVKSLLDDYIFANEGTDLPYTQALESLTREELYKRIKSLGLWDLHHWESDSRRRMARAIEKQAGLSKDSRPDPMFNDIYQPLCYYIDTDRKTLIVRIKNRLESRLKSGLVEEVDSLLAEGVSPQRMERYGLEYRWVSRYLRGGIDYDEMFQKLEVEIRRYAKRQMTFIRYLQKKGHRIEPITNPVVFIDKVTSLLTSNT